MDLAKGKKGKSRCPEESEEAKREWCRRVLKRRGKARECMRREETSRPSGDLERISFGEKAEKRKESFQCFAEGKKRGEEKRGHTSSKRKIEIVSEEEI